MKATKLPSGSWRVRVYVGTEKVGSHTKQKFKSFTVQDPSRAGRRECERLANEWIAEHKDPSSESVRSAIERYIDGKRSVLSPSTYRGYMTILRCHMEGIGRKSLLNLTEEDVQDWINDMNDEGLSPKTVHNAYGLLSTVLGEHDIHFHVKLPQPVRPDLHVPSDAEIATIINYFKEHDKDMLYAVYLAAFGSLRRSEICALTADDIEGNVIHVRRACVRDVDGNIVTKTTKTVSSTRDVTMPEEIIKELPKEGKIVDMKPQQITDRFDVALKHMDLPHIRFHDLRHYTASIMHALGIPDVYIMQRGGWSSDATLKQIYRGAMDDYEKKFNDILMDHFKEVDTKVDTDKKKSPN